MIIMVWDISIVSVLGFINLFSIFLDHITKKEQIIYSDLIPNISSLGLINERRRSILSNTDNNNDCQI